jgi:hypothetical protein
MHPTNKHKHQKNRCVYCGSTDYGKGCRYGPHGIHFHPEDSTKCSFCGSSDYGKGCKINPTSNIHVHGGVYNNMYKETVQSFLDELILIKELKKHYTELQCYKLGLIDENGNKIKNPTTLEEQSSYSPFVKTLLRIKKYLGPKLDLIEASTLLEKSTKPVNEDLTRYKKLLEYQDNINEVVNDLYQVVNQAQADGFSLEEINKLIKA